MARNEQLIRQHRLLQILERYRFGRTLDELREDLVEELGLTSLHTRSVRRDLVALQTAGLDVRSESLQRGRVWKLGPGIRQVHHITASATELIALSLGRDLLYPLAGTPFWMGIESFWNKIQEELPDSVWQHYKTYRQVLLVQGAPAKSYERHHGMLKTLHRSVVEHRVVEIVYESFGNAPRTRRIEPYAVVFYQNSLYIVAADHELPTDDPQRVRHWKLDRFSKATALDAWFQRPADFDLTRHLGQSLGIFASRGQARKFRVRLSAAAARWVREDPWRPDQQLKPLADGRWQLTVQAAHDLEIVPRVLALGAEAELLSPATARRAIAAIVADLAAAYADD